MNKKELISEIAQKLDKSISEVEQFYNALEDVIVEQLLQGEKVAISGFGTFSTVHKDEKVTINTFTKEQLIVPAKVEPKFKFSKVLKSKINK
ncbi:HU family DNA-binding protein [Mycoplasma sp. 1573]